MLSEEAFVLVLGLAATGLLVLGILEALLPRRRWRSTGRWRRARPAPQSPPPSPGAAARRSATPAAAPRLSGVPVARRGEVIGEAGPDGSGVENPAAGAEPTTGAALPPPAPEPERDPAASTADVEVRSPHRQAPGRAVDAARAAAEPGSEPPGPPPSAVERCRHLLAAGRPAEVVALATAALAAGGGGGGPENSQLWGVLGLACRAEGDLHGARAALERAVASAPAEERPTWRGHLVALAVEAGRTRLAAAGTGDGEERVRAARDALAWVEVGRAAGDDPGLDALAEQARAVLWPAYEDAAGELIHRQDFQAARRLLQDALSDAACPADTALALRGMMAATFGGEVGQLTAEAIRRLQEGREEEALAALDRAETVLATIPDDGLPPRRRQELERRLWWGFTRLGIARVEGGRLQEAVEPLMRALAFPAVGPERQEETRAPLARALHGVVEAQAAAAERRLRERDLEGARRLGEQLRALLAAATERGLARECLAAAFERTDALLERLARRAP